MSDAMPDPKQTLAYKAAKLAVIILSALIILALIALVAGAILKFGGAKTLAGSSGSKFVLPAGAKILSSDTQPGRLILHVRDGAGEEIDIVDTSDGHLVSQIKAP